MSSLAAPTDRTAPAMRGVQPAEALALFGLAVTARLGWVSERIEQSYRLVAQVKTRKGAPPDGRWVVEVEGFRPDLYRRGYRMGIFRRVTGGA